MAISLTQRYKRLARSPSESARYSLDAAAIASRTTSTGPTYGSSPQRRLRSTAGLLLRLALLPLWPARRVYSSRFARRHRRLGWALILLSALPCLVAVLVAVATVLFPSYTNRPPHYAALERAVARSRAPGRGNPLREKVFVAASLYDRGGTLVGGGWGDSVLELVELLGPENVYVSLYENDPDLGARAALQEFEAKLACNHTVQVEHFSLSSIPRVTDPAGLPRIKRIAFLAAVRNRALAPLDPPASNSTSPPLPRFDKLLYLNDVYFRPVDALHLLFSTTASTREGGAAPGGEGAAMEWGRTSYAAACAVDFINPFKFYDRFATRDAAGYSMGVPFFPWFAPVPADSSSSRERGGEAASSRADVLAQRDAVRVRSCWGGMVAFQAKWFQEPLVPQEPEPSETTRTTRTSPGASPGGGDAAKGFAPLRFRYEHESLWDASECCLIHADLAFAAANRSSRASSSSPSASPTTTDEDHPIVMNPHLRVAYSPTTLAWLPLATRPERLYTPIHAFVCWLVGFPLANPRRLLRPGDPTHPSGASAEGARTARPGGFCGGRMLLALAPSAEPGAARWVDVDVPPLDPPPPAPPPP